MCDGLDRLNERKRTEFKNFIGTEACNLWRTGGVLVMHKYSHICACMYVHVTSNYNIVAIEMDNVASYSSKEPSIIL